MTFVKYCKEEISFMKNPDALRALNYLFIECLM